MTKEQAIAMLKAKRECIELNTKGNAELCDRNCGECKLCYEQGNMGEQKQALEMAIKALEQSTTKDNLAVDCVSREAVQEVVEKVIAPYIPTFIGAYEKIPLDLARAIQDLPPVTPTQSWIPVSERLPEPQEDGDSNFTDWVQVSIRINPCQSFVCSAYYCFSEMKWYMERMGCGEIIAWQPLPKPYEEKRGSET